MKKTKTLSYIYKGVYDWFIYLHLNKNSFTIHSNSISKNQIYVIIIIILNFIVV